MRGDNRVSVGGLGGQLVRTGKDKSTLECVEVVAFKAADRPDFSVNSTKQSARTGWPRLSETDYGHMVTAPLQPVRVRDDHAHAAEQSSAGQYESNTPPVRHTSFHSLNDR
jgi:hypothetical protein